MSSGTRQGALQLDGRFDILSPLGRGASGRVYRGHDVSTGQDVAIKFVEMVVGRTDIAARFQRERRLLEDLDHPSAVRLISSGMVNETPYLVMELVEGRTLSSIVEQDGPLTAALAADYLDQIAGCLDAAHARRVVHRDLKPGNIMIVERPEGSLAKVLDFGVAKVAPEQSRADDFVTSAGVAMGTPAFMCPEQAMGKPVDGRSDVYSLGVTIFTVLTGSLPFEGKNDLQTMLAHVRDPIPRFREKNPSIRISSAVEQVVRQAMSKEPIDRYPTAGRFAAAFRAALAQPETVAAETVASEEHCVKPIAESLKAASLHPRRSWTPVVCAAVAGVLLVGVLAAFIR